MVVGGECDGGRDGVAVLSVVVVEAMVVIEVVAEPPQVDQLPPALSALSPGTRMQIKQIKQACMLFQVCWIAAVVHVLTVVYVGGGVVVDTLGGEGGGRGSGGLVGGWVWVDGWV